MDETNPHLLPVHELGRAELWQLGVTLANQVLDASTLRRPEYRNDHAYFRRGTNNHGLHGFYRSGVIYSNPDRNLLPVRTPGYAWSFPGYKADKTPVGVVCHEVGHWLDDLFRHPRYDWGREAAVSGYEPNRAERFAEACRLLQTNPQLLRLGRPRRWGTLVDDLGLVPAHDLPWDEVLRARGAHDRFLAAARNWITR